jgi:hypothetical protein
MVRYLSEQDKYCTVKDKDAADIQITHQYADLWMHYLSVELQMKQSA